jgi:hypothetical protein
MGKRRVLSTAVLHIGVGKTGSTAIQHALSYNRKRLEQAGIIYPRLPGVTREHGLIDHNRLAYALFDERPVADISSVAQQMRSLANIGKIIILSAEVFYMRPLETKYPDYADYIQNKRNAIRRTKELLSGFEEIKIICYLRRQDLWFESIYNERVKHWKHKGNSFNDFLNGIKENHFLEQLDLWAEVFGCENIIVRPYEKNQLVDGNVVDDFYSVFDLLSICSLYPAPENMNTINPRLSRDVLEFQKIVYRLDLDPIERHYWQQALWQVSEDILSIYGEPESWQWFLSPEERKSLLNRFTLSNTHVAQKYLGRADGVLFLEPINLDNGMYPGLSIEKAIDIWFRLQKILHTSACKRGVYIKKTQAWLRRNLPGIRPFLSPAGRYYQRLSEKKRFGY